MQRPFRLFVADDEVIKRHGIVELEAEAAGRVALRIRVDDEHLFAHGAEFGSQIDAGRRLADAAFLIDDRDGLHRLTSTTVFFRPARACADRPRDRERFSSRAAYNFYDL